MIRKLLASLLLLAAAPATAQITAVYSNESLPASITIEISPTGDIRFAGDGDGSEMLILGDQIYLLVPGPDGKPEVMRAPDFATAMGEQFARLPQPPADVAMPVVTLERQGEVTIAGRKGIAYTLQLPGFDRSEDPVLVISTDPALAPLGTAMARQFEAAMAIIPPAGLRAYPFGGMLAILKTGAPLVFSGQTLARIDRAPIPAQRFVLPAVPLTLDQVRERTARRFALSDALLEPEAKPDE